MPDYKADRERLESELDKRSSNVRIVMNWSRRGSEDGFETRVFKKGEVYDTNLINDRGIPHNLACQFVQEGCACVVGDDYRPPLRGISKQIFDALSTSPEPGKQIEALGRILTNPATYEALGEDL